jgi:hypothetical protein
MTTLRVWKVTVAEKDSFAKDYWMVPAKNLTEAVAKAKRETSVGWELESAVLVEGDFIMPARNQ